VVAAVVTTEREGVVSTAVPPAVVNVVSSTIV
jgi:hypothetical protein